MAIVKGWVVPAGSSLFPLVRRPRSTRIVTLKSPAPARTRRSHWLALGGFLYHLCWVLKMNQGWDLDPIRYEVGGFGFSREIMEMQWLNWP